MKPVTEVYLLGFQAHKEGKGLQAKVTSVYEVTQEDKVLASTSLNLCGMGSRIGDLTSRSAALANCTSTAAWSFIIFVILIASRVCANLLLQSWIGDLTGWFKVIGGDDGGLSSGCLNISLAWHATSNTE
jgi:hypothetical protein